ncbi:MAG: hypothetical protein SYR96_30290 [Actinomycetota bacterium]|nr:hypothetical protein [Actinomycetota bacterium]
MKQFRRDAGPGVSAYGLEVLQAEVARLAALIGAEQPDVLGFEPGDSRPYVEIDSDGVYHWKRAAPETDRATPARDDVLYWSFEAVTRAIAGPDDERQLDLLRTLDPRWAERRARERA